MQVETIPIERVKPYERNPRINHQSIDALVKSIESFGFLNPIVVDADYTVICGHTRLIAAQRLGMKEVPVVVAGNLSSDEAKAYRLVDNKTGEFATWDYDLLAQEIIALDKNKFDVTSLGFANDIISDLLRKEEPQTLVVENPINHTALDTTCNSVDGNAYQIGSHVLICGCDGKTLKKHLSGKSAKLIIDLRMEDDHAVWDMLSSHLIHGGCFYVGVSPEGEFGFRSFCAEGDLVVRQSVLWKSAVPLDNSQYRRMTQSIIYGNKSGAKRKWYNDKKQTDIVSGQVGDIVRYFATNSAESGDTVITLGDNGNLMLFADSLGLKVITAEASPMVCDGIRREMASRMGREDWEAATPEVQR